MIHQPGYISFTRFCKEMLPLNIFLLQNGMHSLFPSAICAHPNETKNVLDGCRDWETKASMYVRTCVHVDPALGYVIIHTSSGLWERKSERVSVSVSACVRIAYYGWERRTKEKMRQREGRTRICAVFMEQPVEVWQKMYLGSFSLYRPLNDSWFVKRDPFSCSL